MEYMFSDGEIIDDAWVDRMADAAERGEYPGESVSTVYHVGRPKICVEEDLVTVSFKLPRSQAQAVSTLAKVSGQSKSQYLRGLVARALQEV